MSTTDVLWSSLMITREPAVAGARSQCSYANVAKRREHILAAAREMIASDGTETLNVRDLAKEAGVTVPTIYNLIGEDPELDLDRYTDAFLSPADLPPIRKRRSRPPSVRRSNADRRRYV